MPINDIHSDQASNDGIIVKPETKVKIRYGATHWGKKESLGNDHSNDIKWTSLLNEYSRSFNCVELTAARHKVYSEIEIKDWLAKADGEDFTFCPLFPQSITHYSSFINVKEKTEKFLSSAYAFKDHLGPIIFELSEMFTPKRKQV